MPEQPGQPRDAAVEPVVIRNPQLPGLVAALGSTDETERESAIARLILIGTLAGPKVAAVAGSSTVPNSTRVAALRVLRALGGRAAVEAALSALAVVDTELTAEACRLLGSAASAATPEGMRALDALAGLALSSNASVESRLAAVTALADLPAHLVEPIYGALAKDASSRLLARVARRQAGEGWSLDAMSLRELPSDPALVEAAIREDSADCSLAVLRRIIEATRRNERRAESMAHGRWIAARAAAHEALARRNSRIALYDLRETLADAKAPLPIGFLTAAAAVGDASCLEAVAAAWTATDPADRWYRDHLAEVFGAIVKREGLTRNHAALARILARRPAAAVLVALAPKARQARSTGPKRA